MLFNIISNIIVGIIIKLRYSIVFNTKSNAICHLFELKQVWFGTFIPLQHNFNMLYGLFNCFQLTHVNFIQLNTPCSTVIHPYDFITEFTTLKENVAGDALVMVIQ